jgi:uncharacterized membrane protein YfhO
MLRKYWSYLFIFIVWFIFASPYFIKGNVPYPSTYQVNFFAPWSTYPELAGPVKNNAMPDIIGQIYPWKHFTIQTYSLREIPLWNPYSFSGTPHLGNYQSAVLSPLNLLFFILPFVDAWSILVLLQPLLAGIFMYLLTQSLKRSKIGGLISSVSFMFCGFITTWMGYATLGYAILFLPIALYGIEKYFQTDKKRFLVLCSLSVPLSFFSGHFQISLYFLIAVVVYVFIKYLLTKKTKQSLITLLYIFLGLLISMPQLLPSIELYTQSLRSSLFQKAEAIPLNYFPTFLVPDFFGNPVTRNDWFGHYAEWNAYIGIIPFILAIYGILNKKNRQVIYLLIFSVIILCLAFDTPLLTLLIAMKIPVLSTSAASRIIVVYSFIFSILAAFGFDQLLKDVKEGSLKKISALLTTILVIFFLLWSIIFFKLMPFDKIVIARQNLILPTLLFILFAFSAFLLIKFKKQKSIVVVFGIILLILTCFDMLRFSLKWMPFDPKGLVFKKTETLTELQKLSGYDRFLGNLGGETVIYYNLPSVEGYDAVYQQRYGEFISYISDGVLKSPERSVVHISKRGKYIAKAINLLGIKYVVHKKADGHAIWAFPYWEHKEGSFSLIYEDSKYQIFENKNVFPRAFLVNNYKIVTDKKLILNTMFSQDFNLEKELVLEKDIKLRKSNEDPGFAKIVKYTPNKVMLSVNAKTDSLLFLSDSYFPGWKALVDGESQDIYRADYTFRAISVKQGQHRVEFVYAPDSFKYGLILFLLGGLGLLIVSFPKHKLFKR